MNITDEHSKELTQKGPDVLKKLTLKTFVKMEKKFVLRKNEVISRRLILLTKVITNLELRSSDVPVLESFI